MRSDEGTKADAELDAKIKNLNVEGFIVASIAIWLSLPVVVVVFVALYCYYD